MENFISGAYKLSKNRKYSECGELVDSNRRIKLMEMDQTRLGDSVILRIKFNCLSSGKILTMQIVSVSCNATPCRPNWWWGIVNVLLFCCYGAGGYSQPCPGGICVDLPLTACANSNVEISGVVYNGWGPTNAAWPLGISVSNGGTVLSGPYPSGIIFTGPCAWQPHWSAFTVRWNSPGWKTVQVIYYVEYPIPFPPYMYMGNCTVYEQIYIEPAPTFSLGADTTLYWGDSLLLHTIPHQTSYQWQNGSTDSTLWINAPGTYTATVTGSNGCSSIDTIQVNFVPLCSTTVNLGPDTTICHGSTLLLDAGTGFNQYMWSIGSNGQSIIASTSGMYSIVALDTNLCAGLDTIQVLLMPAFTLGPDTVKCQGSTVTLTTGINYWGHQWSTGDSTPTIVVAAQGIYSVQVTDSLGCVITDQIQISDLQFPPVSLGPDSTLCDGDTLGLQLCPCYSSIYWQDSTSQNSYNVFTAGSYWVEVVDSEGCRSSDTVILSIHPSPVAAVTPTGPVNVCLGDSLLLQATPNLAGYLWSNGATTSYNWVQQSGFYAVTVTNLWGCEAISSPVLVAVSSPPIPSILQSHDTLYCMGPASSYQWLINGMPIPGAIHSYFVLAVSGNYSVRVTDANGCVSESSSWSVTVSTELQKDNKCSAFPNPSHGDLILTLPESIFDTWVIEAFDFQGKVVTGLNSAPQGDHQYKISFPNVSEGIYHLHVWSTSVNQWFRVLIVH
jgi:hypothetical protein